MNKIILDSNRKSEIMLEEFFPLKVLFNSCEISSKTSGYYHEDNLLEISIDEDNQISELQLILCKNYKVMECSFDRCFLIDNQKEIISNCHNECECFECCLYYDAIEIKLSNDNDIKYNKIGNVVFGINANQQLGVIIVELNQNEYNHCLNELKLGQ